MYYSEEIIEEVRSRNSVVDVIGSYVHLTKKGGNYFGLCPFHNEKSPSFSVAPSKQIYHCFGCGKSGNVISFVMEYENLSFPEAVQMLAKRAGIDLPEEDYTPEMKKAADLRAVLLQIHKDAAIYYHRMLRTEEGKAGYAYLKKRALTDDTIRSFGLGFASQRPNNLYRYLKSKGYTDEQLRESGLVTFREKGVYDKFWNRVMYPIMDINNRVIAFGGRVMGDGEPKYLNSPETKIFDKSRNLYGLNVARHTKEKYFLLCEGYMDVISMHQAGFTNAVASLGTALTGPHGMILKRYTDEVILCYDNDGAGRKAILRAIPILKEAGLKMKVLNMAPHKDPDEFIKALGKEAFEQRIKDAKNAFLFELDVLRLDYDFSDPDDKSRFFNEAARKLSEFTDEIERNSYIEKTAASYGIDYAVLQRKVLQYGNAGITAREEDWKPRRLSETKRTRESGSVQAQKLILTALTERPQIYDSVKAVLSPSDFSDDLYRNVAEILYDQLERKALNPAAIVTRFIDDEKYSEVSAMFSSDYTENLEEEASRTALIEAIRKVKADSLDQQMNACQDPRRLMELIGEKQKFSQMNISL